MTISENKLQSRTIDQLNKKYNDILESEIDSTNLQTLLNLQTYRTSNTIYDNTDYRPQNTSVEDILSSYDIKTIKDYHEEDSTSREFISLLPPESDYALYLKNALSIKHVIYPAETPLTCREHTYKEHFLHNHLTFKKSLDIIKSSLSHENGTERSNIPLIDTESVSNFIISDLEGLSKPYSENDTHLFLASIEPNYEKLINKKNYDSIITKLSEELGHPSVLVRGLAETLTETLSDFKTPLADLNRAISDSRWVKPAILLKDPDFTSSAEQFAAVFNKMKDTTSLDVIITFTNQSEKLALVTLEPYLYHVMGYSKFIKFFPILHKPGMLTLLLSVTKSHILEPTHVGQFSFTYFNRILGTTPSIEAILGTTPALDILLNNTIPLGGFSLVAAIIIQYGRGLWQKRVKDEHEESATSSVEEILDKTLTDGGFNSALINASKVFTGKLGHELGGILGIFSASFIQGFLYKHKETLRVVAKKVDSKLEVFDNDD
jgi:hypothetical protein